MENSTNTSAFISPSKRTVQTPIWYFAVSCCVSFITICGNGTVIFLILTKRRLRVTANWFVFSLAVADFFVGFFITPTNLACNWLSCDRAIKGLFEEFFLYASICNLCAMTMDRYVAVSFPLKYFHYLSPRRVLGTVCTAWIVPFVNVSLHFSWLYSEPWERARWQRIFTVTETFLLIIFPCVVLFLVNIRILLLVKKHSAQTALLHQQLEFNLVPSQSSIGETEQEKSDQVTSVNETSNQSKDDFSQSKRKRLLRAQSDRKSTAKVIGTVISLFILCWLVSIYVSVCYFFGLCYVSRTTQCVSWVLMLTNSAVNPFVYAFLRADLRQELFLLCPCTH